MPTEQDATRVVYPRALSVAADGDIRAASGKHHPEPFIVGARLDSRTVVGPR
jgi:hypothetical protein